MVRAAQGLLAGFYPGFGAGWPVGVLSILNARLSTDVWLSPSPSAKIALPAPYRVATRAPKRGSSDEPDHGSQWPDATAPKCGRPTKCAALTRRSQAAGHRAGVDPLGKSRLRSRPRGHEFDLYQQIRRRLPGQTLLRRV